MDNDTALRLAKLSFPDDDITKVTMRSKARLWAGMGNIYEVQCYSGGNEGNRTTTLIVKYVHPRLPSKPSQLSIGDKRKLDSYLVEANFYEYYAKSFLEDYDVPLPMPYYVERQLDNPTFPTIIICMGELYSSIPRNTTLRDNDGGENVGVVRWLAKFHAATWHKSPSGEDSPTTETGVQSIGSYWHLDTRPDEWNDMPRHGWEGRLKLAARGIHDYLQDRDPLQCWVHGDTKDANILYYSKSKHRYGGEDDIVVDIAFCDFQYVGKGPPSRDLSYFFCSSHVQDDEEQTYLLDIYFNDLTGLLKEQNDRGTASPPHILPTRRQLEISMELAFCDFGRFMSGWGYWGYDLSKQITATLNKLDDGRVLESQDDYDQAIRRVFG